MEKVSAELSEAEQDIRNFLNELSDNTDIGLTDTEIISVVLFPPIELRRCIELYFTSTLYSTTTPISPAFSYQCHGGFSQGQVSTTVDCSSHYYEASSQGQVSTAFDCRSYCHENSSQGQVSTTVDYSSHCYEASSQGQVSTAFDCRSYCHETSSQGQVSTTADYSSHCYEASSQSQVSTAVDCSSYCCEASSQGQVSTVGCNSQSYGSASQGQVSSADWNSRKRGITQDDRIPVPPKKCNPERALSSKSPEDGSEHNCTGECHRIRLSLEQHAEFKRDTAITKAFKSLNVDLGCLARSAAVHILPNTPEIHVTCAEKDFAFVMDTLVSFLRSRYLFGYTADQDSKTGNEEKLRGKGTAHQQ